MPGTHSSAVSLALIPQKTALIVESRPVVNRLLTRVLTSEGWNIRRAVDNKTVLSLAQECPFDLIVTSELTSGADDIDLLRRIRSVRPHVRMIILVDQWTPDDVINAVREGAFSYFAAPFEAGALVDMVRTAMAEPAWDDGIEVLSATPQWVRVVARCDRVTAHRLVQFLRSEYSIPLPEREDIAFAFHEILLNAIEHGAHFDPSQYVELAFIRSRRAVTLRVKDPGQGFSLEELRHAAINNSPSDLSDVMAVRDEKGLRSGGFGILMAKAFVDEVIYNEHGNDVLLVKYLDPAKGAIHQAAERPIN
jgi:DNA-binding response OmpR family regulator